MATRLIEHGADVIVIHDDTATPTLLGPELFWAFTAPYLAMLIAHIQGRGMPVIVHLCGDLTSILPWLVKLGANALSVDAATSVRAAKAAVPELPIMGNLSTVKLHLSDPDSIAARARQLLAEGVDILGPGCGLSRDTPLVNIQALTRTRGREPGATSESAT